jgi:hypothetical protein
MAEHGKCGRAIIPGTGQVKYPYMHHAKFFNSIYAIGIFSGFIGVTATFWYMSWIAAVVFLGGAIGVFALCIAHYRQLSEDKDRLKKTQ